jgi:SPP1 family predicted phage head-tail adaptor
MIIGGKASNPGELRMKIALYSRSVSVETGGFQKPSLTKIGDVWARWTNVHGSEALQAAAVQALDAATVLIRYRDDIDRTCMVEKGGQFYEIISLDNIQERDEYIELKVRKWQAG